MAGKFVNQEKRSRPGALLICLTLLIGIGVGMMLSKVDLRPDISGTEGSNNQIETNAPQEGEEIATESTAVQVTEELVVIETAVCPLQFPAMYSELLNHVEVVEDDTVMEIFYMVQGDRELELFRIYFSSKETDNDLGFLKTENGNRYITLSICDRSDEEFDDSEIREQYYAMMGSIDTVLASIQNNGSFSKKGEVEMDLADVSLKHWNISIPGNMEWEEASQDGNYHVTFYGNVNGEKLKLYEVSVGEPELKSVLGIYTIDGVSKLVSVENSELPVTDGWTEKAVTELYTMMATINDVINVIMSSENFSAEMPDT